MPKYEVIIPTCGFERWEVEAKNKQEAFEKASNCDGQLTESESDQDPNAEADVSLLEEE